MLKISSVRKIITNVENCTSTFAATKMLNEKGTQIIKRNVLELFFSTLYNIYSI